MSYIYGVHILDVSRAHTTMHPVGRTPLDEWSARRRDLYLTTHDTHNRQISMPTEGFEPTISAGERPQNYALDRAATGTDSRLQVRSANSVWLYVSNCTLFVFIMSKGSRINFVYVYVSEWVTKSFTVPSCSESSGNVCQPHIFTNTR